MPSVMWRYRAKLTMKLAIHHRVRHNPGVALRLLLLLRPILSTGLDMMTPGFHFAVDPTPVQRIVPPNPSQRFEGIDFSRSGNIMAIATSESNSVLLFKRKPNGWFEDAPFQTIGQSSNGLDYPHDVSFSRSEDAELLSVAQRTGAITIYEKTGTDEGYGSEPAFEIRADFGWVESGFRGRFG
jgi:hypothetical protein